MQRYPYTLQLLSVPDPVTAPDGEVTADPGTWVDLGPCRDEPSSGNQQAQTLPDGKLYNYTSTVFAPRSVAAIAPGTWVRVMDGATERLRLSVQRFERNQLGVQLWL